MFIVKLLQTSESHGLMKAGLALHLLKKHHHRHDDDGRSAINTDNYGDEYRSDLLGYPNPDTFDFDNNDELEDYSLLPAHIDQMRRNNFERNMYEGHLVQNRPNLISAGMPVVVGNPIMAQMRMNRMNPMYSMNSMYSMKPMHPMYPMNPMNPMNMNYWG